MDWDDLRYVLAISRGGGLSPAARALGVNASSVFRRLEALEAELGVRLFERLRRGYRLTEAGEGLAVTAKRIEDETLDGVRKVRGLDLKLEGHIRLSVAETPAYYSLPALFAEFRATYPGVTLTILVSNQNVDLTRRDADIVIRVTAKAPRHLVGRSVGHFGHAAYATREYLDRHGRGRPLAEYDWVGFDGTLSGFSPDRWLAERVPVSRQSLRFDSFNAAYEAVVAGAGCGVLVCVVADRDSRLERLPGTWEQSDAQLWVLTHPDLRESARIRACMQFFGTRMAAAADRLLGADPAKPGHA